MGKTNKNNRHYVREKGRKKYLLDKRVTKLAGVFHCSKPAILFFLIYLVTKLIMGKDSVTPSPFRQDQEEGERH